MTTRRIQTRFTKGRRYTVTWMGDSLTHTIALGVRPDQWPPEALALRMRAIGCAVKARNFAKDGNTTTNMLTRISEMLLYDVPDIAVIFGGINDPGSAISHATTQMNLQAMVKYLRNNAKGFVTVQTNLPAGANEGDRYIVGGDTSATGGLTPTSGITYPTVQGIAPGVRVWEARNSLASVSGWSRVADANLGCSRIVLVTPPFLNFTAGGDTPAAGNSHSGQNASYSGVNDDVVAVGALENVPVCDLYVALQTRINAGRDAVASASWHIAPTNQHPNVYGCDVFAQAVLATIQAQSGWIQAVS